MRVGGQRRAREITSSLGTHNNAVTLHQFLILSITPRIPFSHFLHATKAVNTDGLRLALEIEPPLNVSRLFP